MLFTPHQAPGSAPTAPGRVLGSKRPRGAGRRLFSPSTVPESRGQIGPGEGVRGGGSRARDSPPSPRGQGCGGYPGAAPHTGLRDGAGGTGRQDPCQHPWCGGGAPPRGERHQGVHGGCQSVGHVHISAAHVFSFEGMEDPLKSASVLEKRTHLLENLSPKGTH